MDINELKISLLKKIIACEDEAVLGKIEILLQEVQVDAEEPGKDYKLEKFNSVLSKEQLEEIETRNKAYKAGSLETESLETFNQKMFEKYGF